MPAEKFSTRGSLCVMLSSKCNIDCKHCLCSGCELPLLSRNDFKHILSALTATKTTSVMITGGEPTLDIPFIKKLANFIKADIPGIKLGILTNASFATSLDACNRVLGVLSNLDRVGVSYDRFHAEHVPFANIRTLIAYCRKNKITIAGFATITSPLDIVDVLNHEKQLGIKFYYQKVLALGNAKVNKVEYAYDCFEYGVLKEKCPQLASLFYVPSYGITHCCSPLLLRAQRDLLKKVTNRDVRLYRRPRFYRLMSSHTMGKLVKLANKKINDLPSQGSDICELCRYIVPSLLRERQ